MNKLLVMVLAFFALPVSLLAQKTIKGKVVDEDGNGVPNATVVQVKGARKGTQTDSKGAFTLTLKEGGATSLTVTSVGYSPNTVVVKEDAGEIVIKLEKKVTVQDEVVVVGYQTIKRGDINGAVSSVTSEQIKDVPATTGAEALTGRAAGVQVTSSEGGPGAEFDIKLRGGTSITQDNTPLYIVDGVAVENALSIIAPGDIQSFDILKDAAATAIYGARGANGVIVITTKGGKANKKLSVSYNVFVGWKELANTLDVLTPQEFVVNQWEHYGGVDMPSAKVSGFLKKYGGSVLVPQSYDSLVDRYKNTVPVNWQDKLFGRKAFNQSHNITLNGGNKNTQFNASLSYYKEDGILVSTDYNRKLASFKLDHKVTDALKLNLNVRYNNQTLDGAGISGGSGETGVNFSRLRHVIKYAPLSNKFFVENPDDYDPGDPSNDNPGGQGIVNPVAQTTQEFKKVNTESINISGSASYNITKWLNFKTTVSQDISTKLTDNFYDSATSYSINSGGLFPISGLDSFQQNRITNSNVLNFTSSKIKKFKKAHSIDVTLGQETIKTSYTDHFWQVRFLPKRTDHLSTWNNIHALVGQKTNPNDPNSKVVEYLVPNNPLRFEGENKLLSFFGKTAYNYKKKYWASFSYRADGSSKFSAENRWGYFGAGSAAWTISNEKFFKDSKISNVISNLKLRFTYGEAGNNRIDDYLYIPTYNDNSFYGILNQLTPAYVPSAGASSQLANPLIKWETTVSKNLGVDLSLFHNFATLTVDAYENTSNDLLLLIDLPATSGYGKQLQNVGATRNRGLELQLAVPSIVHNKSFNWGANFNITFNKNKVTSLGKLGELNSINSNILSKNPADYYVKVGDPLGQMYGFVSDGFYTTDEFTGYNTTTKLFDPKVGTLVNNSLMSSTQPGQMKFKDLDHNDTLDFRDKTVIGNANPKFYGGLNQQFTYKKFDLSVFVNWVVGNDVYNANKIEFTSAYADDANLLAVMRGGWTNYDAHGVKITNLDTLSARNKNATIWTPYSTEAFSAVSWAVEDASFLRINNITLGYTLGQNKRNWFKSIRFYATVNNLAVITNYSGFDPEVNAKRGNVLTPGVDYSAYPKARSFVFGANVNF